MRRDESTLPARAAAAAILLAAGAARGQTAVEVPERGEARLVVDGVAREWSARGELRLVDDRGAVQGNAAGWSGPSDASFAYALARDEQHLWVAAVVRDERVVRSRAHRDGDDAVVLSLGWSDGTRALGYEVLLQPGESGSFPAAARFRGRGGAVAGAQVVEGPNPDGGFVIEARLPWGAFAGLHDHLDGLRLRVAYQDNDGRPGAATTLATGPGDGMHPDAIPLIVGATPPPLSASQLLARFRDERGVTGAPRLDRSVDLDGDGRADRVVVFPGVAAVFNPASARWAYTELSSRAAEDLVEATLRDVAGSATPELILRERVRTGDLSRELTSVWSLDAAAAPRRVFAQETSRARGNDRVSARVELEPGGRIRVFQPDARGFTAESYPESAEAGVEPPLTPWGAHRARVYAWSEPTRSFVLERSEPNPAARVVTSTPAVAVAPTPAVAARMGPDVEGVLRIFRAREGLPDDEPPSHHADADVAEDPRPERVMVFRRTMVVLGPGYQGGRSYYSMSLPIRDGDAVVSLSLADITGDGQAEALVRVRRAVTTQVRGQEIPSQREMVLGYSFDPAHRGRVFGVEVARRVGAQSVSTEVRAPSAPRNRDVVVESPRAEGWTEQTYPFHDAPPQGFFPLLLPWQTGPRRVVYRWNGSAFAPVP